MNVGRTTYEFEKCVICESLGDQPKKVFDEYHNCPLFNGEPICDICCKHDLDCARSMNSTLEFIMQKTGLTDSQIYEKCMMCMYSDKAAGIYNFIFDDSHVDCHFVTRPKDKEDKTTRNETIFVLFNRECVFDGNALSCDHGAWSSDELEDMLGIIETELYLRGVLDDDE